MPKREEFYIYVSGRQIQSNNLSLNGSDFPKCGTSNASHRHHHHHHHRLALLFRAAARVKRFSQNATPPYRMIMCVHHTKLQLAMSSSTHSFHVFLGLSNPFPYVPPSTCPNHVNIPCLTTSETLSMFS